MIPGGKMKKVLFIALTLALVCSAVFAEVMNPGPQKRTLESPQGKIRTANRTVPDYTFTVPPTSLMTSFYDYMMGGYNHLPLRVIPQSAGGGYFLTYMGQRQATSQRRAFFGYINANGQVVSNNEITNIVNREGFSSMAIDPISGKPIYAWHANADADATLEVQYTSDAFIDQIAGLFNDVRVVIDNPTTITAPDGTVTADNEFIWPSVVIGPSPVAGMRRVYVECPNAVNHNGSPVGNTYIAYADFNGDMIELGTPFVWNYTSIPELNQWDVDTATWRRTFNTITVDNAGNVYYVGTHFGQENEASIDEPDMDIHICNNYGEGTWRRVSAYSSLPSWNPMDYFTDDNNVPFTDEQMYWGISNSGHLNATVDENGKVHAISLWALQNTTGTYWPAFQTVKEYVFDPVTETFDIRNIYPQTENPSGIYQPWDLEAPWGVVDGTDSDGNPLMETFWPFPYWDSTVSDNAMMFHYNHMKISQANEFGQMVAVWQDCARARAFNQFQDTDYTPFANTPEIMIAVSMNNGNTWSEPISLNNVETPAFTGIKPMWPYPADKVINVGTQSYPIFRIGIMFYDDFTWGSYSNSPANFPVNDGGRVMFTEIEFTITNNTDPNVAPAITMLKQNYPNPFNPETTISYNMPMAGAVNLSVYNLKGQLVRSLVNGNVAAGDHRIVWNGTDNNGNGVPSGIYFYRLTNANGSETRKMMLMK